MAERIKLGGLWLNRTRDGREYLSGKLSPTVKLLIFPNDFKSGENQPSHVMYLAPIEQQEETQRQSPPDQVAQGSFFNVNGNNGGGGVRGRGNRTIEEEGQGEADEYPRYPGELETPARTPVGPTSRPAVSRPAAAAPSPRDNPHGAAGQRATQPATRPVSADRSAMPTSLAAPVAANRGAAPVPTPQPTPQRRNAGRSDAGKAGSLLAVDNAGGDGDLDDLEDPF